MSPEVTSMLNDALAQHDLLLIAVAVAAVAVPFVLKVLGKNVPGLDQALALAVTIAKALRKKPAPPAEEVKEPEGIAAVIPLKKDDEK